MAVQPFAKRRMSGMSSVSGAQAALPYGGQQIRLRESKRAAEQAEQTAQTLRQKADEAQQDADRSQEAARGLGVKADQAEYHASQVRRGTPVVEGKAAAGVSSLAKVNAFSVQPTREVNSNQKSPAAGSSLATGVVNLSGQKLGQFINVAA